MRTKSALSFALAFTMFIFLMVGCASSPPASAASVSGTVPAASVPAPSAAPQSTPPAGKALLAISFGTSYDDNRELSIGGIESALGAAFSEYELRRAFTSQIIIDVLAGRGLDVDNVTEAMERLVADGVKEVIIQPTHIMAGFECDDVMAEIAPYADKFDSFKVGVPLLISDEDYAAVADAMVEATAGYDVEGTAILFMGHGTHHEANATYTKIQQLLNDAGHNNYFIATVEGGPLLEDILPNLKASGVTKTVMLPLMVVAGDHANNDMAGGEEGSWKTILEGEGYEVESLLQGFGQIPAIQAIYVKHAQAAAEL